MSTWLVASDVDATLLRGPADVPAVGDCLRQLQRRGVATLLASSKTFGEMVTLHDDAGLDPQPFLFENGAGIGWPLDRWPARIGSLPEVRRGGYGAIVTGDGPEAIAPLLRDIRDRDGLRFTLLGERSPAEIGHLLGISAAQARLALLRLATVPLIWEDDTHALAKLQDHLGAHGLSAVSGGRLVHVAPAGGKSEALGRVRPWLVDGGLAPDHRVLACGDAENDRALLEGAAIALVFHPPDRPPLTLADPAPGIERVGRSVVAGGPRRWLEAVEAALAEAESTPR